MASRSSPVWSRRFCSGPRCSVPQGKDVGGSFQHLPLCRQPSQVNCVVTYVSFRATSPPPANTRFGKVTEPGMVAACTNPAALGGGSAALHAYLDASGRSNRQCDSRDSVGRSGTPDRHALGQRAWFVDGAVHVQRARLVPRDHRSTVIPPIRAPTTSVAIWESGIRY